jgi:hypothetical protein
VKRKLRGKWDKDWLLGFRDITNSTNELTAIFSLLPNMEKALWEIQKAFLRTYCS